jgi:hypothetical protein
MSKKTLHDIFTEIQEAPTRAERQEILKKNDSFSLRTILQLNFDSNISLDLPAGKPPYTCEEIPFGQPEKKIKMLGYCAKGNRKMNSIKKEKTFIDILESLTEEDANIVCLAKDGKIMKEYSRVSESLIKSIFPTLVK